MDDSKTPDEIANERVELAKRQVAAIQKMKAEGTLRKHHEYTPQSYGGKKRSCKKRGGKKRSGKKRSYKKRSCKRN